MRKLAVLGLAACGFVAAYFLLLGGLVYANVFVFSRHRGNQALWADYWIGYAIFYSPAAAAALLAAWASHLPPRGVPVLLAAFLCLIIATVQWTLLQRSGGGALLIAELAILSVAFAASVLICRYTRRGRR